MELFKLTSTLYMTSISGKSYISFIFSPHCSLQVFAYLEGSAARYFDTRFLSLPL